MRPDGRKPKVKANIKAKLALLGNNNRNSNSRKVSNNNRNILLTNKAPEPHVTPASITTEPTEPVTVPDATERPSDVKLEENFEHQQPHLKPDGRVPRVKADIKARLANKGKKQDHHTKKLGHLVRKGFNAGRSGKSIDVENDDAILNPDDDEPVVRPDGQKPRVKSNILLLNGGKRKNAFKHSTKVDNGDKKRIDFVKSLLAKRKKLTTTTAATTITAETTTFFQPTPSPESITSTFRPVTLSTLEQKFFTSGQILNTRALVTSTTPATLTGKKKKKKNDDYEYDYYYYDEFHDHLPDSLDEKKQ